MRKNQKIRNIEKDLVDAWFSLEELGFMVEIENTTANHAPEFLANWQPKLKLFIEREEGKIHTIKDIRPFLEADGLLEKEG